MFTRNFTRILMLDTHRRDGWDRHGGKVELLKNGERRGYGESDENTTGTILLVSSRTKCLNIRRRSLEFIEIVEE